MKMSLRPLKLFLAALSFVFIAGTLHAQEPALPPGTTSADSDTSSSNQANILAQAEDDLARSNMKDAIPLLNSALAQEPNNARALYDRGYAEESTQQTDAAITDFQKAVVADPKQFESHAALASLYSSQGKFDEARKQLEAASTLTQANAHPTQTQAATLRLLARVDNQLHDPSAAAAALLAALKLTPEQPEDTLLAAQLADEQCDASSAAAEYRKALDTLPKNDPAYVDALSALAQALTTQEKFSEAEPLLRQALAQQPKNPALIAQLATVLASEGKKSEAITELEALHQAQPDQHAVTRMLADLYTQANEAAKADPLYTQLLAQGQPDASLLTARGENLIRLRRYAEAATVLQQAVMLQSDLPDTWSDLAFAASQTGQYPLVLHALDQRANFMPDTPATLFLRATVLDHLHQTKLTIAAYKKFIQTAQDKSVQNQFSDQVWQAQQRIQALEK